MKGIWKTSQAGWNVKGHKYKKQSIKHLIKDNSIWYFKNNSAHEKKTILYGRKIGKEFTHFPGPLWSSKKRKKWQKIVTKSNRTYLKTWIQHSNFDKPIPQHKNSKSIEPLANSNQANN